ncbi:MAG TPA: hypothetical protein VH092_05475 [Urbifossiella sp.]|jgi:hypothetical protein|nr:hypothetical protein [Urbifossiella sp.]
MRPGCELEDRAWRGYDPRAAVPAAAAAAAASAALLAGRWAVASEVTDLPDRLAALAVYASVLAVWPTVLGLAAYRAVVRTYRLTDRAVLVDWGPLARPEPPVWLDELAGVRRGAGPVGRWLGIGWVELREKSGRVLRLTGVRDPAGFAAAVEALVTPPAPPPH